MSTLFNFFESVLAELTAALLLIACAWFFTYRFRHSLLSFVGRITGSGIDAIYKNDNPATKAIVASVNRSDTVRILSMRAFRLLKDDAPLSFLLTENCPIAEVRVLLADAEGPVVKQRASEFINIDTSYTEARYIEDIKWSARQVAMNQRNSCLEMRVHRQPAFIRLLITDDHLFLSFFLRNVHGDNSPVYQFRRTSPLYEAMKRYFDWVWYSESVPYRVTDPNS